MPQNLMMLQFLSVDVISILCYWTKCRKTVEFLWQKLRWSCSFLYI